MTTKLLEKEKYKDLNIINNIKRMYNMSRYV